MEPRATEIWSGWARPSSVLRVRSCRVVGSGQPGERDPTDGLCPAGDCLGERDVVEAADVHIGQRPVGDRGEQCLRWPDVGFDEQAAALLPDRAELEEQRTVDPVVGYLLTWRGAVTKEHRADYRVG